MNMLQNLYLKAQLLGVQSNFGHNPDIIIYSFIYSSPITYTKSHWLLWDRYTQEEQRHQPKSLKNNNNNNKNIPKNTQKSKKKNH